MTKAAQNLLLILVGAAVLWITVATDEYLNYVKPGFRYLLVAAAAAMLALGAAGLRKEWRDTHDHDHDSPDEHGHHGGPRVAWLLCLPAMAIFLIAPPALGSFTASRNSSRPATPPPPPDEGYGMLKSTGSPIPMTMGEYIGRSFESQTGHNNGLPDIQVRLTGFVTPRKKGNGWHLTRLKMACCAGDAIPFQVIVYGPKQPPADSWIQVVGTFMMPTTGTVATGVHELRGQTINPIKKPKNPYE